MNRPLRMSASLVTTVLSVGLLFTATPVAAQTQDCFPERGARWRRATPGEVGLDAKLLAEAIAFAKQNESRAPRDLALAHELSFGREPVGAAIGPHKERGDLTGVIVRHGRIVAEWGEPDRVDMTFSVTKSFLSTVVGLAVDDGLIADLHDPVRRLRADRPTSTPSTTAGSPGIICCDRPVTGRASCGGKPDWADRPTGEPQDWPDARASPARHAGGSTTTCA